MRRPIRLAEALVTVPNPRRLMLRFVVAATITPALVSVAAPTAFAQPTNDNFVDATVISTLPFSTSVDLGGATTEPDEPLLCGAQQTVWYALTPTSDAVVRAEAAGSNFFDTNLSIYQADGPGLGGLTWLGCGSFGSPVVFDAHAGTTYYIQGGSIYSQGGTLGVRLEVVPPPPNDDFANAIPYAGPFSDTQDITGATTQANEPPSSCLGGLTNTIWYSFTPTMSGPISADTESGFSADVAVYTGTSLETLTELGCSLYGGFFNFHADAGTTYYFQAGSHFSRGLLQLNVMETPPPNAAFGFGPNDPSIFDTIEFVDFSTDPFVGIQSSVWDFGDGATAQGCCPTHRYVADGDYTVQLTVTTFDGRIASTSQLVQVRTHDVAVVRIGAPNSVHVGQIVAVNVGVANKRYPETVRVDLFKSVPGGFQQVGSLTQSVPVRPPGATTTRFAFSYTIVQADGTAGKVSFKAVATIIDHRDALPADNELISPPVKVT